MEGFGLIFKGDFGGSSMRWTNGGVVGESGLSAFVLRFGKADVAWAVFKSGQTSYPMAARCSWK
jgi:hypothetical protein